MTAAEKAARFQALHRGPDLFVIPNPWDAGSAKLLAALGFPALATSSAASAIVLGLKDGALSREDVFAHAAAIVAAVDVPVSADLESGFGDRPEDAARTIADAAAIGLAGGSIEDTPRDSAGRPYDFTLAVERVAAAAESARRQKIPFTLTARAENFLRGNPDLDDTLRRLKAFEEAGADVLFAPGLPSLEAVRAVCGALKKPVNFVASVPGKSWPLADLRAAGVRRVSLGASLHRAALGALLSVAKEITTAGTFRYTESLPAGSEIYRLLAAGGPVSSAAQSG